MTIDNDLLAEAQALVGIDDRRQVVAKALKTMIRTERLLKLRKSRGRLYWEGDLDGSRGAR